MSETIYYDGTKLLSMKDINGKTPEIFMVTSNRSAGKTTYFERMLVNRFLKKGDLFGVLFRYKYELDDCANKFFNDISKIFFPNYYMKSVRKSNGAYHELYLHNIFDEEGECGKLCGYALALNSAEAIKRNSHLLSDIKALFFDEFQSETGNYCPKEVTKFQSIHYSLARGNGEQVRYLPVYMCSNPITILNPYYVDMKISARLKDNTKFLRGDGFVLEQGYNESASEAQAESLFNRALSNTKYACYAKEGVYLNDNLAFIENPVGKSRYICTIRYMSKDYGIREYTDTGIMYCTDIADSTYRYKISVTTEDHNVNYIMLRKNEILVHNMKYYFNRGCFRFKNLACKEALFALISY